MKLVKALLITLLFIFAITFAMENNEEVYIHYYNTFNPIPIPVFLIVMVSIFIGILLVGFAGIIERIRLKGKLKKQEKEIKMLKEKLNNPKEAFLGKGELR
jgi:uncharacterized integral membrane protein